MGLGIVVVADGDFLTLMDRSPADAADHDAADVFVVIDGRDHHLEGAVGISFRRVDVLQDLIKQRPQIGALHLWCEGSGAVPPGTEDHRAVQLFVTGVQIHQKLQNLLLDFVKPGVGAVDLVDHYDDLVPQLHGLLQHETGLGHGTLKSIYQQQDAVHHLEHPLHFAAEIGVAGGVDDVDLHAVIGAGRVLCEDGNAPLPLQIVGVHDTVLNDLILPESAALLEHLVYQRGFAMVNVGDDGDVSQIFTNQK